MSSTTFVNGTPIVPAWLNDVNTLVYGFPSQTGQAGKVLGTNGSVLSWVAQSASAGGFKNAVVDFSCDNTGVNDTTTALQNAITTCENNGWALFMPNGTYKVSSTLVQTKRLHLFGEGAELTTIKSSASEAYRVAVPYGSGLTFCYYHDFSIIPATNGTGTNGFVARLVSDAGSVCYMSNWTMERVRIGDFGGYGVNLDNSVGNLNGFFTFTMRRNWITNGAILNKCGDSINIEENTITDGPTIQANKTGGRVGILYTGLTGARQVVIRSNNITTSGGAIAALNCEQVRIENNQIEHPVYYYIPYYASGPYGAMIYLYNSYAGIIRGNTVGAGSVTTTVSTGTTTNGSNSITGVTTTNLYVGCTVVGTGIPASTRITNIVGTTVTISNNATASGTPSLTFGYSADQAIFFDGGTIKTVIDSNDVTSGTYYHYTFSNGCYDNNVSGQSTYAGISTGTPTVNDQTTGSQFNNVDDLLDRYTQDPLFYNPFCDIWNGVDPASNFAAGFQDGGTYSGGAATATAGKSTGTVYPGNPSQVSLFVNSVGATINNGVVIVPATQPWRETGWISGCIAIYAPSNAARKVLVYGIGGTVSPLLVGQTTTPAAWNLIKFRFRVNAGNNWGIQLAVGDGLGTYYSGWQFFVGGVNLVRGPIIPNNIQDSVARRTYVTTGGVGFPPPFIGARAFISGTGKYYLAANSLLATDWILLN